ncbi:response regulator transcription factor [Flavobacteriales bacterium]|jgi:DNA-binding response OmpR family regulator|nr:response regulator transcription factor [Flavobacteriales bacterium]
MSKAKILLVEDDQNLGSLLSDYLSVKGYETTLEDNGDKGLKSFIDNQYDICLLDVMMPIKDGFTLAREIRNLNNDMPIIFLTAKSMKDDKLEGFKAGADDYMTKPFSMDELLVRIQAVLRRSLGTDLADEKTKFKLGTLTFDSNKQVLSSATDEHKLTSKESQLLRLLALNPNKVLERSVALNKIWSDDSYFNARSMDVYITKLRKYLKLDSNIQIQNVHGRGFKLLVE